MAQSPQSIQDSQPSVDADSNETAEASSAIVKRAFGEENRARLLEDYFAAAGEVTAANAWQHVYRLLLWADPTTGLAHCYESDKCQPGRPWYARSLAFHAWVSHALESSPEGLAEEIDLMFRWVTADLAVSVAAGRAAAAKRQREPYAGLGFPEPGMDTGLEAIITEVLGPYLRGTPPAEILHQLGQRIHAYIRQENKRKNL